MAYIDGLIGRGVLGRRSRLTMAAREALWGYFFLLPNILGFLIFTLGPVLAALFISLTEWDAITAPRFVGVANYSRLLLQDETFRKVLVNTVYYTGFSVPCGTVLALALALLLNQKLRGVLVYRTVYFLPVISSMVGVALVWQWLYNAEYGLINQFLFNLGITGPKWLASTRWAMPAVIIMSVWKGLGYNIVIFLAGLQDVPQFLYEAAELDGANGWQKLRNVTLPMLYPTTFFVIVMSIIGSFQAFDQVYVMTGGGPARATSVIVHYLYQSAFQYFEMGYASAMAYVLFVIIFVVTLVQVRRSGSMALY